MKFLPDSSLRDMIRFYWFLEGSNKDSTFGRILPFGALDIIIHRGTPMSLSKDFKMSVEPQAFVEGQYKTHQFKKPATNTSLVGVSIYPWASEMLFGVPSIKFTGEIVDLNAIPGSGFNELLDIVQETGEKAALIERMNLYFIKRIQKFDRTIHEDLRLFSSCLIDHNDVSIQEVTDKYWGNSLRLLQIRFKETFGLTISEFRRKQRLQKAVEKINRSEESLTNLALELGFFDQAHFTKTFKSFAGISPRNYAREILNTGSTLSMEKLFS